MPFGGAQPYDLVVQLAGTVFLRVQCKSARQRDGCAAFNARTTDHGRGRLSYEGHADVFAVYFPPMRSVYLVPVREVGGFVVSLRLAPTRNNQRRGIRFAADYVIDRWAVDDLRALVEEPLAGDSPEDRWPARHAERASRR